MPANAYNWVPDDVSHVADEIRAWLGGRGYSVKVETAPQGAPFPPTFLATRGKLERLIIEVMAEWKEDRFQTWLAFARACPSELKVCIGLSQDHSLSQSVLAKIRKLGIGVVRAGEGNVFLEIEPADASISVSLPLQRSLDKDTRALLGTAYDHFEASRWREGFEDACKVLEKASKRYLKRWIKTGRLRFIRRSRIVTYSDRQVDRFTIGALENAFQEIQAQNSSDRVILQALRSVRKDRNGLTHDKWNLKTEKRLRVNVAQHMWIITQALAEAQK